MRTQVRDQQRISEEAAEWLMELEESPTPETRAAFVDWLKHSPAHMDEFLLVTSAYRAMHGVDPDKRIDVQSLLGDSSAEIVRLRQESPTALVPPRAFRPYGWAALAAASVITFVAVAIWLIPHSSVEPTYTTAVGEQRTVKLSDSSVIYLNTRSRVRIDYTAHQRSVDLLEGEALFVVESDPARPFRVHSGNAMVQALGTQFNVYRRTQGTTVSVVEGLVRVERESPSANAQVSELRAGEQVHVKSSGAIVKQAGADLTQAVAWRQRQLVFRATPLADIVAEFNRYNELQIRVEDPTLAARPLTAVFNADNPRAFVKFLETDQALEVQWRSGEVLVQTR